MLHHIKSAIWIACLWFSRLQPIRKIYLHRMNRRPFAHLLPLMSDQQAAMFIAGQNSRLQRMMGSLARRVKW